MQTFSVGECFRFGWDTFKKRPWFFVGISILIIIISAIASRMSSGAEHASGAMLVIALAGVFIGILLQIFLKMGILNFFLKTHETPLESHVMDLWAPQPFWKYLGASLLFGIIVAIGFILLVIPGIYLLLRFLFVPYLVMDRKLAPFDALRESSRITLGHKWQLLGFLLAVIGINIIGAILLGVGLLVTIPVSMLAAVHAYRTLEHRAGEIVTTA
jgi:uncharacterized membrane protein